MNDRLATTITKQHQNMAIDFKNKFLIYIMNRCSITLINGNESYFDNVIDVIND